VFELSPMRGPMTNEWFTSALSAAPVMAVLRGLSPNETVHLSRVAWDLGCEHVEVPIERPEAVTSLRAAIAEGRERGKVVGAGTILHREQVMIAHEAGAAYLVSPGLDLELIKFAADLDLPFLPGVATATEIVAATSNGLTWLKGFPAAQMGPGWFKAMKGPFPEVHFVATGGVTGLNAAAFLSSGVDVVGVGAVLQEPEHSQSLRLLLERDE
jgi:2-dehydro-3-deoxyphosphogluconate aldolase / (4S)-4-hydroxy-2-oxoglutarate aldolase